MTKVYEFVALFSPELLEHDLQSIQESFITLIKKHKGKVLTVENWGKRPLSYEIKKFDEANYLFFTLELDTAEVEPFNQDVRLNTQAIRHLFVIQEEHYKKARDAATPSEDKKNEE
ncbi:MAG: 30S ribosomal protein S6 [Patescibacteria group bacterium]